MSPVRPRGTQLDGIEASPFVQVMSVSNVRHGKNDFSQDQNPVVEMVLVDLPYGHIKNRRLDR